MEFVGMKRLLKQFMYNDRMTVSRQVASLDAEGADDYRIDEIYHEIPCHLGSYEISLTGKQSDRGDVLTQKLRIDCAPSMIYGLMTFWPFRRQRSSSSCFVPVRL